jgi:hypothetical protein
MDAPVVIEPYSDAVVAPALDITDLASPTAFQAHAHAVANDGRNPARPELVSTSLR